MSPYERALSDGAFLTRFAGAYRGAHDPIDALWWQEHPDAPAPSGAQPPAAALAEARRAMYAPRTGTAARERYRRLAAEQEQEAAAVESALGAAADTAPGAAAAEPGPDPDAGPAAPPEPARRSPRSLLLAAAAVAVAFVAGVLVAPAIGRRGAPEPAASPSGTDTAPFISGSSGSGSALGIFGEPQRDVDRPAFGADARLLPQTFRRLESVPVHGVDVYAAQDSGGDVCLVALTIEGHVAASCAPIDSWRRAPLRLTFRADAYTDDGRRIDDQVELVATWAFLGPFALGERAVGE